MDGGEHPPDTPINALNEPSDAAPYFLNAQQLNATTMRGRFPL